MAWRPAPADIYARIERALFANKDEYFHSEYPDAWLEERLRRYLPRLPFYCSESCLLRPVVKREYLHFEQIVSFGEPSPRQAGAMMALAFDLAERLAQPILAESFNPTRHRLVGDVSEKELQFPLFNRAAADPWDNDLTDPSDPHSTLERVAGGELPEDVEAHLSPLYGYLYFEEERSDAAEIVERVSRFARVLHVSSWSRSLTQHLHRAFAAKQTETAFVGAPRINYITTIPNIRVLDRFRRRARVNPVSMGILLEGRLHEL